jgi:hypothetical protein
VSTWYSDPWGEAMWTLEDSGGGTRPKCVAMNFETSSTTKQPHVSMASRSVWALGAWGGEFSDA